MTNILVGYLVDIYIHLSLLFLEAGDPHVV